MVEGHHGKRGGGEHQRIAGLTNGLTTGQEKKIPPRGAIKHRHSRHASLWRLIRVGGITEAVNQPPKFLLYRVIRNGGSRDIKVMLYPKALKEKPLCQAQSPRAASHCCTSAAT
jgi:hypothetical protein